MDEEKNTHRYDDMINLPYPIPTKRPRMSAIDRAAQFSPFAALTGHDAAIKETARLTERRIELDEYEKAALDEKLRIAKEHLNEKIELTYFVPDEQKEGGSYHTEVGFIKKIDSYERKVVLQGGNRIPIDDIIKLDSEMFSALIFDAECK